tara:strand:+ start:6487 stop:6735 length:249 start_codon:yes stop_codon:yes gene_type:complete
MKTKHNTTTAPLVTIFDAQDSQNRQFIWTLYRDGSALTRELTHHTGDPALQTKETYREIHPAGSETARDLFRMAKIKGHLPA